MITPWNWPINQISSKVAPALVTGCTMVLKPSEIAPLNALVFAEVLEEAGTPPGVFNLVNGDGPSVGAVLSSHPEVDLVSCTGSTRAGVAVAAGAAAMVKRVHQELGDKSPNIILPPADLMQAVAAGVRGCFGNSGQSCNAPTRMLVPAAKIARATAASLMIGPPAELVAGGPGRPPRLPKGWYVRPTVFANVTNNMTIAREEIFGPALVPIGYETVTDAIRIANDTPYGLATYVQGDHAEAIALAGHLRAGIVRLNAAPRDGAAPFGGYGQSGNGREYGLFGLKEFTEIKVIVGYSAASSRRAGRKKCQS